MIKCSGTGRKVEIAIAQYSEYESGGSVIEGGDLSLGNNYSASFSIEKLA